ncbi:hypothetical protein [Maribellus mangrovi]|uniref:hypothetical protein n=1 Tax=Maribellus mangrovi TaxID=3133146 RepID=UPI0030EC842B
MKLLKQKVIRVTMSLVFLTAGLITANVVLAQERFILSTIEFSIKTGHERQFENGIKAWKTCYLENGGEWTWTMWKRYNGEGSVYVLSSRMDNWAELDKSDESGKECRQIVVDQIIPHIESTVDMFSRNIPDISRSAPSEMGVIWVTFFQVENNTVFRETINEISGIIAKAEGDERGYWYSVNGGGPDSPDYFVTTPFKNFAALDVDRDGVWKMVENSKGEDATEKMRVKFRESVSDIWAYMFKMMDELSHNPEN